MIACPGKCLAAIPAFALLLAPAQISHNSSAATLTGEPAGPASGPVWRRGETGDPGTLDPHKASTSVEQHILDELYEGLLVYDGTGRLRPGVAARWTISADGLTYTFALRPDARWSDGSAVTADDFVFSFRRLLDPRTGAGYATLQYAIRNARAVNTGALPPSKLGVHAVDPATLAIELEHPDASFLAKMTHMTAMPVFAPGIARWGDGFARAGRAVGNGAFVLVRYVPGERLVLRRNAYFHDAAAVALAGEDIIPISDRSAGLRRFMAGEIDSYNEIPVDQIRFAQDTLGREFKLTPSLGTLYFSVDTRQAPFGQASLRTALAAAIDRRFLAQTIWAGAAQPSYSFVPPGIPDYGPPSREPWADQSQFAREDDAIKALAQAGFGPQNPLPVTIRYDQSENYAAAAIAVADMWKPLGITTSFVAQDSASYFDYLASGKPFEVARDGWFADYPDAANFLFLGQSDNRGLNYAHFSDPLFDQLMRQADGEQAARRRTLLHEAETRLLQQAPYIPLLTYDAPNLVSDHLHGWTANVLDHHPGRFIRKD